MEKVSAGYDDKLILESIKLNLVPGSRIGLLGHNGAGKSTLIKLLAGTLAPLQGEIGLAKGVKLGYFAQHQLEFLRADESPLQHLVRLAERETEQQLRDYLGGFGFRGDKVTEITARFSGEKKPGWCWRLSSGSVRTCCCSTNPPTTWISICARR